LQSVLTPEEILPKDMDDLVFEDRNKAYGAYFLRRIYSRHLLKGFVLSVFITLFICFIPFVLLHMSAWMLGAPQYVEVQMTDPVELPLPPSIQVKLPGYENPELEEASIMKTVVPDFTKIVDKAAKKDTSAAELGMEEKDGSNKAGGPKGEEGLGLVTEIMPSFPGGKERMDAFIRANVIYPQEEVERRKQGKVYVSFLVTEEGILQDIKIAQGVSELLDAEAIRVIKMMPPWNPGFHKGNAIPVPVKVPISFRLN
jgi:periplasmic protein TonB